jgi:ElaB/YqjD/DUF883 family membrane-anchored ribosome-binding protein
MDLYNILFIRYPVVGYSLTAFLIIFVWWLYANKRPAFPGKILGILLFYGHLPDGYYRRFTGLMVDITDLMLSKAKIDEFLKLSIENVEKELEIAKGKARSELEKIKKKLSDMLDEEDITEHIQVLGTRRDFVKHIWICVGVNKPIERYAIPSKLVSFEWAFLSFVRRLAVWGIRYDIPKRIKIRGIGTVKIHIFMPMIDPEEEDYKAKLYELDEDTVSALGYLGSSVVSALKLTYENKALKREIKALRDRAREQQKELSRLSKELDIARLAAASKPIWPPSEEEAKLSRMKPVQAKYMEFLMSIFFGEAIGFMLLPALGFTTEIGVFIGTIIGAFLFYTFFGER